MAKIPTDHVHLIAALGGAAKVAAQLEIGSINVRQWTRRKRIPPEFWGAVLEMAAQKPVPGVTLQWMLETMPERKAPSQAAA
ncbi:MAG: hypothetical protein WC889_02940 [Myxococcota bacterium]|jgi:hypothetical protein